MTEQRIGVAVVVGRDRDAHARRQRIAVPVDDARHPTGGEDPTGDGVDLSTVGEAGHEEDELVTAEPGDDPAVADLVDQPLSELDDERVADLVPEAIVHSREPVDVETAHGEHGSVGGPRRDRVAEQVEEPGTVRQTGEGVAERERLDPPLGLLALADVVQEGEDAPALDVRHGGRDLDRPVGAVLAAQQGLAPPRPLFEHLERQFDEVFEPLHRREVGRRPADHLVSVVATLEAELVVHVEDHAGGVEHAERLGRSRQQRTEPLGAFADQPLCLDPVGDVTDERQHVAALGPGRGQADLGGEGLPFRRPHRRRETLERLTARRVQSLRE
ncbi:MAG: hypothetical protein R2697_06800 [Ilumatobacteraceae bacterium]